jgi:hypothetical protein
MRKVFDLNGKPLSSISDFQTQEGVYAEYYEDSVLIFQKRTLLFDLVYGLARVGDLTIERTLLSDGEFVLAYSFNGSEFEGVVAGTLSPERLLEKATAMLPTT